MRAAEIILKRRPKARIVIVGGDEVSYGRALPDGQTYRKQMLEQVDLDMSRVFFIGRVPYGTFLKVIKISGVHVYLTYPFQIGRASCMERVCQSVLIQGGACQ